MMASVSGINKIVKLPKIAATARLLSSRRGVQHAVNFSHHLRFKSSQENLVRVKTTISNRNFSTITEGTINTSKIDEFRAREEQKEQEFQKVQKPLPAEDKEQRTEEIRTKILEASLDFVPTHGWTKKALAEGAQSIELPGIAHGMFPNGGIELLTYFCNKCNKQLLTRLKSETNDGTNIPIETTAFLIDAIKFRLQLIEPYISQWPQALAIMSMPQNAPTVLAQILTMVDDICYYAGDRSVDFGWYARRVGVAGIFKMTELYMLQDSSMEHQATWKFLETRMKEATQLESILIKSEDITQNVRNALTSAFTTARNILGMGRS